MMIRPVTHDVIRWEDGWRPGGLDEQLRARPYQWAVVAEGVHDFYAGTTAQSVRSELGDQVKFEVRIQPVDDGEYGAIYEITARFNPDADAESDIEEIR